MLSKMTLSAIVFILMSLVSSCKTTQKPSSTTKASSRSENLYSQGFTIASTGRCKLDSVVCDAAVYDSEGHPIDRSAEALKSEKSTKIRSDLSLDTGTFEGDVIFKWPAEDQVINRDYAKLGELMEEYGSLVGTLLHRTPEGEGEITWRQTARSEQGSSCRIAKNKGSEGWCKAVVDQLVDRYMPSGSKYRQYGNCGEGGKVGACLAKRAGFSDDEIRLCTSDNDHFFAMVKRGVDLETKVDMKWCILDRWDLIGRFKCEVDVDTKARIVTLKGVPTTNKWLDKVTCKTLAAYLKE